MFVCVHAPNLIIQIEAARHAQADALIVVDAVRGTTLAASADVWAAGVIPAMSGFRARQIAPWTKVIESDERSYHACHDAIAASLTPFSERIETVALGVFLLDFPDVACGSSESNTLVRRLIQSLQTASDFDICVGVATNRFTAEQAAQRTTDDNLCIVPTGQEARFLAPLSVSVLPGLPLDLLDRLTLLGIRTLGQLVQLSQAAVVRQFGKIFALYHALARGKDPRPLCPDAPPLRLMHHFRFEEACVHRAALDHALSTLSQRLAAELARGGYQVESLRLRLTTKNQSTIETIHSLKPPTAELDRLTWLASHLLDDLVIATPVHQLTLVGYPLRPWHLGVEQLSLFEADREIKRARMGLILQTLSRRFGVGCVKLGTQLPPPAPIPITVVSTEHGDPIRVQLRGNWRTVDSILEHWHVETGWWHRLIDRHYFQVLTSDGVLLNLYRDQTTGEWFLDRRHYVL